MKKLLILISIVAASMFATVRAAEPTVLYERGGDGTAWSDADLANWNTLEGTASINEGLCISWGNSGWSTTKEINFTENSIVTLTTSFTCGNTGRAGAFEYIELGGVQVRMDGQGQKGYVSFDGTNWSVDDNIILSGNPRSGSVNVTIIVNQATKDASITVSGSCTGTAEGKITDNIPNKVIFGYHKNGSLSGNRTATLKSIEITEEIQEVAMASYAVNYVCNGTTIKSEEGSMAVGAEVSAISPLTIDGQKYYFADGATTSMTIQAGSENVLNVEMREAYVYNYTVSNNVNDEVKTDTCIEGESVTVPYNKYILKDGTVWTKDATNSQYNHTFTPITDNYVETLEYTKTEITDGIFFKEGEDIEGMTVVTRDNASARCSNGAGGHAEEAVTVYTLKPGTYKLRMGVWGNAGSTFIVKAGEQSKLSAETKGYWLEAVSEEFTITAETALTFEGSASNKPLDYILITGTVAKPVTGVTINNEAGEPVEAHGMTEGETYQLSAVIEPENADVQTATWNSDNEEVATVVNGKVTARQAGEATITATAGEKSATCKITVKASEIVVTALTLDKEATVAVDGELQLTATVEPAEANVIWTSSDVEIATVDETGKVTGVAAGEATITAKAGGMTAECIVTVIIPVESIALNYSEISFFKGMTHNLSATVTPVNATDKSVTWTSGNEEVATVDENGNVTAVAAGEATITAKAGEETAECKIIVKAAGTIPTEGTVLEQTFNGETILESTEQYIWGADIQGMIKANGVYMTNGNNKAGNYENRDFLIFANPIGSSTQEVNVSYNIYNVQGKGQADTYYDINYLNADGKFVFGIREGIGDWKRPSSIVIANEDGSTTETNLTDHLQSIGKNDSGGDINITVRFSGDNALIELDGNTYTAYTNSGFQSIKLSVSGDVDYDRSIYIKNFAVKTTEVEEITTAGYILVYKCGDEVIKEEPQTGVIDSEIIISDDKKANFFNEDKTVKYIYVSNDAEGKTVDKEGTTVVTLTYREAATWNYTVKNNVNDDVVEGSVLEGEKTSVAYHRYILKDGKVYINDPGTRSPYTQEVAPDKDGYEMTLYYTEDTQNTKNAIYFVEAEDIDGVTKEYNTASARSSYAGGGYTGVDPVTVYTLKPGTYTVEIASMGGKSGDTAVTYTVKAGDSTVIEDISNGSWHKTVSSEFTVNGDTELTVQGGGSSKPFDYILITGTVKVDVEGIAITDKDGEAIEKLDLEAGDEYQLAAAVAPENATDATVTWESSNTEVATVADGKVTAVGVGTATITASCGTFSATCTVKVYPRVGDATMDGNITITDAVEITNYVVEKKTVAEADKDFFMKGADANGDKSLSFADASAAAELALSEPAAETEEAEQARIRAFADESADALVIGRADATSRGSVVPVALANSQAYVALQADIILPEGMSVDVKAGSRAASTHTMMTRKHADNHIRVVFFNLANDAFAAGEAPMFEIVTDSYISASDIVISTVLASDADANEHVLAARVATSTAVEAIGLDGNAPVKVYDVNGMYVGDSMEGLQQGTYIVRQGEAAKTVRIR